MPYAPLGYQTPIPQQDPPQSMPPPAPPQLPPQAPMSFAPMALGPGSQWLGQPGALPPDQQSALIAQVQAMLASDDPRQKAMGEALLAQHGRSLFAMGLNRATGGLGQSGRGVSDALLSSAGGAYSPEALDFGNRLTRAARPDAAHDAEMIGAALGLAPLTTAAGRTLRLLRGGGPPGRLPPPATGPAPPPQVPAVPPSEAIPYDYSPGWMRRMADDLNPGGSPLPPGSRPPQEEPLPKFQWPKGPPRRKKGD